jgi:hypothetical protein
MSIPTLSADIQNMDIGAEIEHSRFPAATKQSAGLVGGTQTDVSSVYFADKIIITISQGGRLSQWVYIHLAFGSTVLDYGLTVWLSVDPSAPLFSLPNLVGYGPTIARIRHATTRSFNT